MIDRVIMLWHACTHDIHLPGPRSTYGLTVTDLSNEFVLRAVEESKFFMSMLAHYVITDALAYTAAQMHTISSSTCDKFNQAVYHSVHF